MTLHVCCAWWMMLARNSRRECTVHAASGKKSVSFCCGQGSSEIGSCFEAQQSVSHCLESLTSVSAHIFCNLILCMPPSSQLTCTQLIATQCLKLMPVNDCWLIVLVRYDLLEWKDCKYLQVARPRKKLYKLCTSACTVHLLILLILYRRGNYAGGHCQLYVH